MCMLTYSYYEEGFGVLKVDHTLCKNRIVKIINDMLPLWLYDFFLHFATHAVFYFLRYFVKQTNSIFSHIQWFEGYCSMTLWWLSWYCVEMTSLVFLFYLELYVFLHTACHASPISPENGPRRETSLPPSTQTQSQLNTMLLRSNIIVSGENFIKILSNECQIYHHVYDYFEISQPLNWHTISHGTSHLFYLLVKINPIWQSCFSIA